MSLASILLRHLNMPWAATWAMWHPVESEIFGGQAALEWSLVFANKVWLALKMQLVLQPPVLHTSE